MTLHVVGAGLAGLAAALEAVALGLRVVVHEAAALAGGRCRSWHDPTLDATIDNGAHVIVGANTHVERHLAAIGSAGSLAWLDDGIALLDLDTGLFHRHAGPRDLLAAHLTADGARGLLALLRLLAARDDATIGARLDAASTLTRTLWVPLATAVMNLDPQAASAGPFARTLRRTLLRGARAMRIGVARTSLAASFVDPAVTRLREAGTELRFGARLRAIEVSGDAPAALHFADARIALDAEDAVILALPPWELAHLLPELAPPHDTAAIVNLHARLGAGGDVASPALLGLLGGEVEWIMRRGDQVCATVSAADRLIGEDPDVLARRLWRDVARALGTAAAPVPPLRLVKERRATPAQTPDFERLRPGVATPLRRVLLAGDWVVPGLPCTIDSALSAGADAARRAAARAA
ncbi:MAG: FAD-dependent oxidoreductase [Alphaproteobacteria bacterium]|nr:FAD-dependent oxidoreductase [Alphaproteobacteria bacterium]